VLFALAWFTVDIPDPNAYVNSQATVIQYSNGQEIGRIGAQNRQILPLAKIPLRLRYAVMAAEDKSFYSNRAFSITGLVQAVADNVIKIEVILLKNPGITTIPVEPSLTPTTFLSKPS
jgi:membrane carboxypeptidase/penicillin-binding protein